MKHLHSKSIYFLLLAFLISTLGFSQNGKSLWSQTTANKSANSKKLSRKSTPQKAVEYQLDIEGLKTYLLDAPTRESKTTSHVVLNFPLSNGSFEEFTIQEASVLHPDLQAKMPNSRSYVGKSIEHPENTIRFSITSQGLHTMYFSAEKGTQFIDPVSYGENDYLVYSKNDLPKLEEGFSCGFEDEHTSAKTAASKATALALNDGFLRTYRLAIASTIEYSEFHWTAAGLTASDSEADKKNAVMDAMIVTMTRVNGVYERELSVTMEFVADNKDLIFIDSDSFTNDNDQALIDESQIQIDAIIGNANYDIGHTFSTGAGGLAQLGSVCVSSSKARGITGLTSPVGDAYDIDFVAHELGHQFGATHTFNSNQNNCSGSTRSSLSAYEPGSGTTIMAYAGLCDPDNIQANSDDYFHINSLQLMWNHINSTNGSCAVQTASGNAAPEAFVDETTYTIPQSTPYKLTGSSTDADGITSHTYTWEQYDLGDAGLPSETSTTGPLVRSYKGTTNPVRYIPNLIDLSYSNGSTTWEKLAAVDRDINFKLTVRDNDQYGRIATADMTVTTVAAAGPFVVTSQNVSGISWTAGNTESITWDVAGTTANGINAANVNILLSTNGGQTYDTVLASNVPNDGTHDIVVPDVLSGFCRIMIEASDNIFFALNTESFSIGYTVSETCTVYNSIDSNLPLTITDEGNNYTETSFVNVPNTSTVTDIKLTVNVTHEYIGDILLGLQSPDGTLITVLNPYIPCQNEDNNLVVTFDDNGIDFNCNLAGNGLTMKPPSASLNGWNGESTNGNWILGIGDFGAGDIGILNSWSIEVCSVELIPLGVETYEFKDLVVYPNPNKGEFTIKLNSEASDFLNVEVIDLRGRVIYNNTYNDSNNFKETIRLNQAQPGMYILKINDGLKQSTKKIIIE